MRKSAHSPEHKLLIKLLVEARQAKGLTQQEFADQLGVQQSLVARCESGQRRIDVVELVQMSNALGTDPLAMVRQIVRSLSLADEAPKRRSSAGRTERRGPYKQSKVSPTRKG